MPDLGPYLRKIGLLINQYKARKRYWTFSSITARWSQALLICGTPKRLYTTTPYDTRAPRYATVYHRDSVGDELKKKDPTM